MKKLLKALLSFVLCVSILLTLMPFGLADGDGKLKVGAAKVDITGPITDISTGYNSLGNLMEGLLTRLYARAFVIDNGETPVVFVSAELVHMTESIKPGVIARLRNDNYDMFSEENVMLTATHCHSSTSNTLWFALYDLINGVPGYDDESYKIIVRGIAKAIEQAYDNRVSGSASLVYKETTIRASNRSADAFLTNKNVGEYYMPYDDLSSGTVKTSEPCIGAGIIAGDEEGAPVDNAAEGAVRHQFIWNEETQSYERIPCDFTMIDLKGLQYLFKPLWPTAMKILQSDGYDKAQAEKVVCLAVGKLMQKAQPLQIMRIGSVAIAGVPFELTFEQANRTRTVLENTLSSAGVTKVIIATHANAYSQYVTTREEYAAQHYEGATCLFGPWSGAALTQELDKLAQGIVSGEKADPGAALMQKTPFKLVYTAAAIADPVIDRKGYGEIKADVSKDTYAEGEWVTASFKGVNPRNVSNLTIRDSTLVDGYSYMEVQKQIDGDEWVTVLTDTDPYTTFRRVSSARDGWTATVGWLINGDSFDGGTYRLVYNGIAKSLVKAKMSYIPFSAESSPFKVIA